jgi:hypothetical protein
MKLHIYGPCKLSLQNVRNRQNYIYLYTSSAAENFFLNSQHIFNTNKLKLMRTQY